MRPDPRARLIAGEFCAAHGVSKGWPCSDCIRRATTALRLLDQTPSLFDPGRPEPTPTVLSDPTANMPGVASRDARATSRAARVDVMPKTGTQRWRVLSLFIREGRAGWTDDDGEAELNMRHTSYTARRGELVKGGWLRDSGATNRTTSGSRAIIWELTEAGESRFTAWAASRSFTG